MFFSKVAPETWSLITPFIHEILDELYDHALEHDSTAKLYAGQNIEGLKAVQKTHWELTFKNGFDASYDERAYNIGHSHAKIGLTPSIITDNYGFMTDRLMQRILMSGMMTKQSVFAKKIPEIINVIFRDLSYVLDIYYHVSEQGHVESSQYVLEQSREFSHRMSMVSEDVQSVATAVDQMDSSISNISKNVDESSNYARAASERADSAAESMQSVTTASEEIGSFLSIITEIADKTKLLAVNAAIEAARAGEAGKGFTVVADEVRQLAEGTESGARDVALKVEEIQRSVGGLQRTINSVRESFQHVLSASDHIVTAVHQQSSTSRDMSDRMRTVNNGLDRQVNDLTQLVEHIQLTIKK